MNNRAYLLMLFFFSTPCHADFFGLFGSDNYYECILDDMPGERNHRKITTIQKTCRKKHPISETVQKQHPFFSPHTAAECLVEYGSDYQQAGIFWIREACLKLYY